MTASRRWIALLSLGAVGCVAFMFIPQDSAMNSLTYQVVVLPAIGILLVSVLRMPPAARPVWWAVFAYAALSDLGDLSYDAQLRLLDESPYPGIADVFYLASYIAAMTALAILIRRTNRGRDLEAWIDTAILSLAAAAIVGLVVIAPILDGSDVDRFAEALSIVYPILDLVVLSGLTRLLVGPTRVNPAIAILAGAFAVTLVADLAFSFLATQGLDESVPTALDALYLVAYIAMAAAANAPGATAEPTRPQQTDASSQPLRTTALTAAALTLPILIVIHTLRDGLVASWLLAVAFSSMIVILLILWRVNLLLQVVEHQSFELAALARTDSLTGLPNRGTLDFELERLEELSSRAPLTIAMMDLDYFKSYNDEFGHQAGDAALMRCADAWEAALASARPAVSAFLARYGGEEFVILLPGLGLVTAAPLLGSVHAATPPGLTVSIGFAERAPAESGFQTMRRADRALYRAKRSGRDRVVAFRSGDGAGGRPVRPPPAP